MGQCDKEFGFIIDIWKYHMEQDDLEGVVQDTTGNVVFNVRFDIIAFKPEESEILDGIVTKIHGDGSGFDIQSGPLKSTVQTGRMPGYTYDNQNDQFMSKDSSQQPIRKECSIRHKIQTLTFDNGNYEVISSIQDDYLGVIAS